MLDRTAANITSVVFSLSACPKYSSCADFAIDTISDPQHTSVGGHTIDLPLLPQEGSEPFSLDDIAE